LADLNVPAHIFHAYNLENLIFAVLERRLVQHWIDCTQFFFYVIFAVLTKYHDVNSGHNNYINQS